MQKVVDQSADLVLAIYPGYFGKKIGKFGFSVGWYNEKNNYSIEWGNFKRREKAELILRAAYPNAKIINLEKYPKTSKHEAE